MQPDAERRQRLADGMRDHSLDAVIATLPENVLLLTGYLPVIGTSIAIATVDRQVLLLAPHDERQMAETGHSDQIVYFAPASQERITTAAEAARDPLRDLLRGHGLEHACVGHESGEVHEPASYASMHLYGDSIAWLCAGCALRSAGEFFSRMKATLTAIELDRLRTSCRIAVTAFQEGKRRIAVGMPETTAAAKFREQLFTHGGIANGLCRTDGYVNCMAGAHSAEAFGAYAWSRNSPILRDRFVLVHCNSHADGYWTDITRTYCMGEPDDRQHRMYQAVFEARQAALAAIRPGVNASEVDRAARDVMRCYGLADNFKHSTGHGVGFAAIDHNALPRLHPASNDRLESGMVFNVEPAAYIDGYGGVRHCDMVVVTPRGSDVLTPCQCVLEDLIR